MFFAALDLFVRALVIIALAYASAVALTHWLVRSRKINPFGAWPRLMRRVSDPVLLPLEARVIRAGGSPQDAPLWLVGGIIVAGLLLLSLTHWVTGMAAGFSALASAGPRVWTRLLLSWAISLVMAAIFVRVIASWFGISPYRRWMRPVVMMTGWIIEPIRRLLPPLGMIDFSPMVAWLVLYLLRGFLLSLL